MKTWDELLYETAELFGGQLPRPDLATEIQAAHNRAPQALERAIDQIANEYAQGNIRSPWGILKARLASLHTPETERKATNINQREKAVARAEQWIRTAGLHYDRETELLDELYGDRGPLRAHPDTKGRILELWNELRPLGVITEQDHEQRMARYRDQPKPEHTTKHGNLTTDELKALATKKSEPPATPALDPPLIETKP